MGTIGTCGFLLVDALLYLLARVGEGACVAHGSRIDPNDLRLGSQLDWQTLIVVIDDASTAGDIG